MKLFHIVCPCLPNFVHLFMQLFRAHLWGKCWQFSLITLRWLKIEVRSKQNQLIRSRIKTVTYAIPDPISFHLASLSPCLLIDLLTTLIPTGILYLHIFIYSLPHSFFSLNNLLHSPLSPLPPTALSVNKLKFVCHRGETEGCCPSNLTWFITPLIESDQKPIESQRNICISPSSVWFNCQCCQSCFRCYLPEPCHSSLPCNLVSRFMV